MERTCGCNRPSNRDHKTGVRAVEISLKPEYLKRYKDIAMLFVKYGSSDLVKNVGLDEALNGDGRIRRS